MVKCQLTNRQRRHVRTVTIWTISIIAVFLFYHHSTWIYILATGRPRIKGYEPTNAQAQYWRELSAVIANNHPGCMKRPDPVLPRTPDVAFSSEQPKPRPDILWMDEADIQRMRTAHSAFLSDIRTLSAPPFQPDTRGIVTISSESTLLSLFVLVHTLKQTGSSLPIEIFLPSASQYTQRVCSNLVTSFNASCYYLDKFFEAAGVTLPLDEAQLPTFAILLSTFDDILFLDSVLPVRNPDHLFILPPFTDTGLILWPDDRHPSESPYFFAIANLSAPALNERPAIRHGSLMLSKQKHSRSLLLATYYNIYGPEYYYLLLGQGGLDPEMQTFLWAASVLGEAFYEVRAIGQRLNGLGNSRWSASILHDPVEDLFSVSQQRKGNLRSSFVHIETPIDLPSITNWASELNTDAGSGRRGITRTDGIKMFGNDLEQRLWGVICRIVCEDLSDLDTIGRIDRLGLNCMRITKYLKVLSDVEQPQ